MSLKNQYFEFQSYLLEHLVKALKIDKCPKIEKINFCKNITDGEIYYPFLKFWTNWIDLGVLKIILFFYLFNVETSLFFDYYCMWPIWEEHISWYIYFNLSLSWRVRLYKLKKYDSCKSLKNSFNDFRRWNSIKQWSRRFVVLPFKLSNTFFSHLYSRPTCYILQKINRTPKNSTSSTRLRDVA